ncbi:MAG: UDP-N-acetylmuramoyl-L-alanyl-D-glutamate--2,6-diaminopimelate ligase [Lentisphaerae bacterium]|nr:UDP-N-acetylmuramoyl-L-alanyl-D-glutamate--2,6-diaminopimelate ligase [Lentisphaerota bacterium]
MLKYALALRTIKHLILDRCFVRPIGDGAEAEAALDLIMETVSVLDYDCDYLPGAGITQVTNDSRQVKSDSIFAAIPGATVNGEKFAIQAQNNGAKVLISEHSLESVLQPGRVNLLVKNAYTAYALLCEAFHDFPAGKLCCLAVTGTNGKTTTAMLTRTLLQQANQKCGMISTVEYDLGAMEKLVADRTTPEAGRLFDFFDRMVKNQQQSMIMEVSSHALHQNRIGNLRFQGAVFTNLTGDHLDYHGTMEEYYQVKKRLFTKHLADNATAVINCDDAYGLRLSQELPPAVKAVTFGRKHGAWRISNEVLSHCGSSFTLSNADCSRTFCCNLNGMHNIYNLAGTVLLLDALKLLSLEDSAAILQNTPIAVPGRLERFDLPDAITAFVDYAHTHDALSNVLSSLKALDFKRIITVFGAGGDRDKSKRPLMGKAAADQSDVIILTSDNPRSEDPMQIIDEIRSGIPENFPQLVIEPDRHQAITLAIKMAAAGDALLIAGKGHENYQIINGTTHHFDDREVLREFQL